MQFHYYPTIGRENLRHMIDIYIDWYNHQKFMDNMANVELMKAWLKEVLPGRHDWATGVKGDVPAFSIYLATEADVVLFKMTWHHLFEC